MTFPIRTFSRGDFVALTATPDHAVLSFANLGDTPPSLEGYGPSLCLGFNDTDDGALGLWARLAFGQLGRLMPQLRRSLTHPPAGHWPCAPPTLEDAQAVLAFARSREVRRCKGLLIHCEYGRSRSVLAGRAILAWWEQRWPTSEEIDPSGLNRRWARLLSAVR